MFTARLYDPDETPPEPTVESILTKYIKAREAQAAAGLVTATTAKKARLYCLAFSRWFGPRVVSDCRKTDMMEFLSAHPEYKSPHTIHDALGIIVTAFRWAEESELITRCPYQKPKDLPTPEPRAAITREEVRAILKDAKDYRARPGREKGRGPSCARFRLALWFLWETGIRTCELYRLDWSQYDDAKGCFELRSKTTKKTGKPRLIALPPRAWRFIRWMRSRAIARTSTPRRITNNMNPNLAGAANPVFLNGRGRAWTRSMFGKRFVRHAKACGIKPGVTAYSLRHGFTCRALEAGVGERQLADYLGHANTKYINWYGRGVKSNIDYLRNVGDKANED